MPQIYRHTPSPHNLHQTAMSSCPSQPLPQRQQHAELTNPKRQQTHSSRRHIRSGLPRNPNHASWIRSTQDKQRGSSDPADAEQNSTTSRQPVEPPLRIPDAELLDSEPHEQLVGITGKRQPAKANHVHTKRGKAEHDGHPKPPPPTPGKHERSSSNHDQINGKEPQQLPRHTRTQRHSRSRHTNVTQDGWNQQPHAKQRQNRSPQPTKPSRQPSRRRTPTTSFSQIRMHIRRPTSDKEHRHHLSEPSQHPPPRRTQGIARDQDAMLQPKHRHNPMPQDDNEDRPNPQHINERIPPPNHRHHSRPCTRIHAAPRSHSNKTVRGFRPDGQNTAVPPGVFERCKPANQR